MEGWGVRGQVAQKQGQSGWRQDEETEWTRRGTGQMDAVCMGVERTGHGAAIRA